MTQSNFIFHAHTAQGDIWRNASPVNFVFHFIHLKSERLVYPFWWRLSEGETELNGSLVYLYHGHTLRDTKGGGWGGLIEMRIEMDYWDRTALLREWNLMFLLGLHKIHQQQNIRLSMAICSSAEWLSGPLSAGAVKLIEGVKEEIKVIMYIPNPQHFKRAKRQNSLQPQNWAWRGCINSHQGQLSPWQQIILNNYLPYVPCHN